MCTTKEEKELKTDDFASRENTIPPNKDNNRKLTDQLKKKKKVIGEQVDDEDSGKLEYFTE